MVGLDMLRAVAISMVLASHCGSFFALWLGVSIPWQIAVFGFYGVELFFVLSGFLIGRLLLEIIVHKPDFRDWRVFMVRRWLRTLPLYYVCLAVLALVSPPLWWQPGRAALWRDLPWYLTMTQNLGWRQLDDWFSVTWSLAVEEWFYLTFSAFLLVGARWFGRRPALWGALLTFTIVPMMLRWWVPAGANFDEFISKVVPFRLDAIAAGVAMAWLQQSWQPSVRWRAAMLALGVAAFAFVYGDGLRHTLHMRQPIWQVWVFDCTSVAFALFMPAASTLRRSWRGVDSVARALSAQSYALYLIHLDLMLTVNTFRSRYHWTAACCIVISVVGMGALSYLSYWYFERPILARRPAQSRLKAAFSTETLA
jgi:peptidoglycan/LPS O-acetylase OafA/YrhL